MQIHVVQAGQTLYRLSQAYGVPIDDIASANELSPEQTLVIGQALVIPIVGRYYDVAPGDTLASIAAQFGSTAGRLASVNDIGQGTQPRVGTRLYIPPMPKRKAYVNAYLDSFGATPSAALTESARQAAPHLTYLAPSSFRVQRDGSLQPPPLGDLPGIAAKQRAAMMLAVTNLDGDQFSDELGHAILSDSSLQDTLIANIVKTAKDLDFRDVHFDLEHLYPGDREPYNRFLRKAAIPIHAAGLTMSTALAPKTSATQEGAWYSAHDYRAHGEIADFVVIMTYEWGYSGGPPMAVSPIGPVRTVLEYALTEMPAGKILMGQNLYGYDWTLPYVSGGPIAKALSPQAAIALARTRNAEILYDATAQAPYFTYWDDKVKEHRVWFEDARSIQAKFDLLKELKLRGISYWKLGLSFPQNWLLLEDNFDTVKLL
ncbi:glycoside hydrolase family 18 protein [Paenibacillus glycinis]|uniref:LysM peptidoglycan-binding domain-containing protein n=1 Tax=Paenibacillus glycinis TaxID=2697035 RepID=A0ABW9XN63_9BACL|nr:glycoside hydrolase family 18 protein [Paenibacillus glycinis]NBD24054.1 LysM peptidoglycan-binding domain-containing protein [Paenibacillus glycinis]